MYHNLLSTWADRKFYKSLCVYRVEPQYLTMDEELGRDYSDEQLAEMAAHDQRYFGCLIERYEQRLMRFICRLSDVSHEESEDILQEVFLKAYLNIRDFDTSLQFSSWIYRITRNEVISQFRKRKARPHGHAIDVGDEVIQALADTLDVSRETENKLLRGELIKVLDSIDKKYREVLVLQFFEERTYDEIADILRKPPGTVASLVSRAKKQARAAWEEIHHDTPL